MSPDELQEIRKVSDGLEYPSESDAPFDLFRWPKGRGWGREQVVAHGGANRKVEEVTIDAFFAELVESDDGARYKQLRRALESQLKELNIFRVGVGEPKVDIYLVGRTRAGDWAGLHTTSIET
ncbi:MAG: Nuclease inhibitor-like protein [Phycisphaerales bacterium]|nr:Nuclease inhibitor-like protein [Phycisphaerales bacterium]